jgi:hypothetical protein
MLDPNWQVVSHWIGPNSSEHIQTKTFGSYAEAWREAQELAALLGAISKQRMLKGIQITGDFKTLGWRKK